MNKFLFNLGFIFVVYAFLHACSSNKNKEHQPAELTRIDSKVDIDYLWSQNIGKLDHYYNQFEIALDDKHLYAASEGGTVVKVDTETGGQVWEVELGKELTAALAIDSSRIFVGTIEGKLVALDKANGQQVWSRQLSSEMISSPVTSNEHLVVQTGDGAVYDVNPEDGTQRWKYDSNMPSLTLRGTGRAVFFDPYLAIGFANGMLGIIDIKTGQLRWQDKVGIPQGDTEIERLVDVDSRPIIIGNRLYAVSYQGRIVAYDIQTGQKAWSSSESSYLDMAKGSGNLYVTAESGAIKAYDQLTGKIRWQQDGLLRRKPTAVTTAGNYLVVSDLMGYMHILDQNTGAFAGRRQVTLPSRLIPGANRLVQIRRLMAPNPGIRVAAVTDDMRVYLLADNGQLIAYQLKLMETEE